MLETQTSFLCPSLCHPQEKWITILGINFRCILAPVCRQPPPANPFSREQKRHIKLLHIKLLHIKLLHIKLLHIKLLHIKLLHIKLFPVAPVTGPPGRVSGQKDLCSLGSEDST